MSNISDDPLFSLIQSMTKSEKRQFKLYVNRLPGNANSKYLSLFILLEKLHSYDDKNILKNKIVKKEQLSNLKAHLYKQILTSLQLNLSSKNKEDSLYKQFDFARILYQKRLYRQCFKILEKVKQEALSNEYINICLEIVEFEKSIENQVVKEIYKTNYTENLIQLSEKLILQSSNINKLSNLAIRLYNIMLRTNYARSSQEAEEITRFFNSMVSQIKLESPCFMENLWFCKAHLFHSFLTQDFPTAYKYASKLVALFHENPNMIDLHPVFFIKSYNYLLEILFTLRYLSQLRSELEKFQKCIRKKSFPKNGNTQFLIFLYQQSNTINLHFLQGNFRELSSKIPKLLEELSQYKNQISGRQTMVLYYKIACFYFGIGDNINCILFLKKIIENKKLTLREDLMCFARILNLIAHYEEGFDDGLEKELKSTYKFLIRMNDLHKVQLEIIKFLRNLDNIYPQDLRKAFKKLLENLKIYENDPYERRSFLYLDLISWLESKVENIPILEIVQKKATQTTR